MDIKAFRETGLLEMYLIGACSPEEIKEVEAALDKWPELQDDIKSISKGLEGYSRSHGVTPSEGLKEKIMDTATSSARSHKRTSTKDKKGISSGLVVALGLLSLMSILYSIFLHNRSERQIEEIEKIKIECDSLQTATEQHYAILDDIRRVDNQLVDIAATEQYADARITLFYNPVTQKNYLQLENLPDIGEDQSFQLWSLKPDQDPIPLTVFQGDEGLYVVVDYEEDTPTYAITIEPRGGRDTPTLANLVGTWSIG